MHDGCWYCGRVDGDDLVVTCEFDALVHISCVRARVLADPDDREAAIIHAEVCHDGKGG